MPPRDFTTPTSVISPPASTRSSIERSYAHTYDWGEAGVKLRIHLRTKMHYALVVTPDFRNYTVRTAKNKVKNTFTNKNALRTRRDPDHRSTSEVADSLFKVSRGRFKSIQDSVLL